MWSKINEMLNSKQLFSGRSQPFQISFISDAYGLGVGAPGALKGASISYWQTNTC